MDEEIWKSNDMFQVQNVAVVITWKCEEIARWYQETWYDRNSDDI